MLNNSSYLSPTKFLLRMIIQLLKFRRIYLKMYFTLSKSQVPAYMLVNEMFDSKFSEFSLIQDSLF